MSYDTYTITNGNEGEYTSIRPSHHSLRFVENMKVLREAGCWTVEPDAATRNNSFQTDQDMIDYLIDSYGDIMIVDMSRNVYRMVSWPMTRGDIQVILANRGMLVTHAGNPKVFTTAGTDFRSRWLRIMKALASSPGLVLKNR